MIVSVNSEHYQRVHNFRVDDVVRAMRTRPERLYPHQKFTPDPGVIYERDSIPKTKFNTLDELLAAVNRWCS